MSEEDTMSGAEQLRHPTPKLNGGSCRLCRGDRKLRTYSVGVLMYLLQQFFSKIYLNFYCLKNGMVVHISKNCLYFLIAKLNI